MWHWNKSKLTALFSGLSSIWQNIVDSFYSSPVSREIGWYAVAILYIGFLLLFTHVDLIISLINNDGSSSLESMLINKHAHFVSLATNIGLLLFIMIDIMISFGKQISNSLATIINLVGVLACVLTTMCAMGCTNTELKSYGALEWKNGIWICLTIFFLSLIVLKQKSLNNKPIDA